MLPRGRKHFLRGLALGVLTGGLTVLTPALLPSSPALQELLAFCWRLWNWLQGLATTNLQGSILPFSLILGIYLFQMRCLDRSLASTPVPLEEVVRHEQLVDLCANLIFGVGVIWTAIGMRDALLYSLGDPDFAAAEGAFAMLQRLVEGGILVALSTTIVGGIGGYLMRVLKSVWVGPALNAAYLAASAQPQAENLAVLQRIEKLLDHASEPTPHTPAAPDGSPENAE